MKSKIFGLLAVGLLGGSLPAQAVTLQVSAGILTGATGVDVGGTLYDVTFQDGTCFALFSGCDNAAADFAFQTQADAEAASAALLAQVLLDGSGGSFDTNPALTRGCTNVTQCYGYTPYSAGGPVFATGAFLNTPGVDTAALVGFPLVTADTSILDNVTFSIWRRAVSVPEPGTLALLGLGLLGLGATRRRKAA
jgi:hypothetical protein